MDALTKKMIDSLTQTMSQLNNKVAHLVDRIDNMDAKLDQLSLVLLGELETRRLQELRKGDWYSQYIKEEKDYRIKEKLREKQLEQEEQELKKIREEIREIQEKWAAMKSNRHFYERNRG